MNSSNNPNSSPASRSDSTGQTHVVLGAGQIGRQLAEILLQQGHEVRIVRRSQAGPKRDGLSWVQGDISDSSFAAKVGQGADVVYNCMNPAQYHRWDELLPPLLGGAMEVAKSSGARLVALDNLYMYGPAPKDGFSENTPMAPCSKKGELRKRLAEQMFEAHYRGEVRVCSGRASDFFGPGGTQAAIFNPRFFDRLQKGKSVEVLGDPNQPHAYTYIPDVARGLATLGNHPEADGQVWHLPTTWQSSTAELIQHFADHFGVQKQNQPHPQLGTQRGGLFVPLFKAVAEMTYQWEAPFLINDQRFVSAFGLKATPLEQAIQETADWALGLKQAA